jgi:diaminohydroxyphosphoribosylaminopyrimidine deaminase / 5-amino-6-(5-phosphoribosylamino)uracil reductase
VTDDHTFMRRALALAEARLGRTWPNPSVGCVIVKDGAVIAEGVTGDGGRPHGEEVALACLSAPVKGATVYLVLEPCARRSGVAASCTDRLIAAGVARVVISAGDPHPNARGAGVRKLKEAGVAVESGLCQADGEALNAGFFSRVTHAAPIVCADADPMRYDSMFNPLPGETHATALARLASIGLTRLCVAPGSALAVDLEQQNLLTPPFRLSP